MAPHMTGTPPESEKSWSKLDSDGGSQDYDQYATEPIAVCGMSCRLPGKLHTPQAFWDFLMAKGDARGEVPKTRYSIDTWYSDKKKPGSIQTKYGNFLDESVDLAAFDTTFFLSRREEVGRADPHHRQMLEVVREAFEDGGVVNWRGKNIGCFMGTFGEDWIDLGNRENQPYGQYTASGKGDFMLPNRISFEMDLRGPSQVYRTACSSALVALHEACLSIYRGDSSAAVVGGANLIMAPAMTCTMSEQGVLSPDGSCKTFSADANGYSRGEAINAIFIKPLKDAIRDGNPVRAVIRSTASNCDGRAPGGATAPSSEAQVALMKSAYAHAGIEDFSQTAFIECHGTGTPIGDPIETDAVAEIFGPTGGIYITSVKPNLGHSEGASGLTSVIKSVLALENKTIPPNIKFTAPNEDIKWDAGLKVPVEATSWPVNKKERVSVNSFGIGGSNAHVILDSAASFGITRTPANVESSQLLVFTGTHPDSIKKMTENIAAYLEINPQQLGDVAHTLANQREHLAQRCFAVAKPNEPFTSSALTRIPGVSPKLVMVFTGQGAQWPEMGRELFHSGDYPAFKQAIKLLDKHLQTIKSRPTWTIEAELLAPPSSSHINTAEMSQPLCTAVQLALLDTLEAIGVVPSAVVGHSSGEIAAAYAAGALTAREAIIVAYHRGQVSKLQKKAGAMAAIGLCPAGTEMHLVDGVVMACHNSPASCTISGDAAKVRKIVADIKAEDNDTLARVLKVDKAYHSHHMVEIGEAYHDLIENEVTIKPPNKCLFFSSVTGAMLAEDVDLGSRYWQRNLESPVLFCDAVTSLLKHEELKHVCLLEVGPHPALQGPLRQIGTSVKKNSTYTSLLSRDTDCVQTFLAAMGSLFCANVQLDLSKIVRHGTTLPDLPRYPFAHPEPHWHESRLSKEWRFREHAYHDLLGVRLPESTEFDPTWRNVFHLSNVEWMRDHKVGEDVIFPFAGYAGMIGEAIRQVSGTQESFIIRHVIVTSALVLTDANPTEIMTSLRRQKLTDVLESQWYEFTISSYKGPMWQKHCVGLVKAGPITAQPGEPRTMPPRVLTSQRCYDTMVRAGAKFGPTFRTLQSIRTETIDRMATATAVNAFVDKDVFHLHPALIDAGMQLTVVAATRGYSEQGDVQMLVPVLIEELSVFKCSADIDISATAGFANGGVLGESVCTAEGQTVMQIKGLRLMPVDAGENVRGGNPTSRLVWGAHIDFESALKLFNPIETNSQLLEELATLCMQSSAKRVAELKTERPQMQSFLDWIKSTVEQDSNAVVDLGQAIEAASAKLGDNHIAEDILNVHDNFAELFDAQKELKDVLEAIPASTASFDKTELLRRIAFSRPNLRILQIADGSVFDTARIHASLRTDDNKYLFSNFSYAVNQPSLLEKAKQQFSNVPNMEFLVLDLAKDLAAQAAPEQKFDLVIAEQTLFIGKKELSICLGNARKLLTVEGRLLLEELDTTSRWSNYLHGALPDWRIDIKEAVSDATARREKWQLELQGADFDVDVMLPADNSHAIVARPKQSISPAKKVTILCNDKTAPCKITAELEERGYTIDKRTMEELPMPAKQDIVATLDLHEPFLQEWTEARLNTFRKFVEEMGDCGLLWVTHACQIDCHEPEYARMIGLARNVRAEAGRVFATCETDDINNVSLIADVFNKFQNRVEIEPLKPDMEYAISQGKIRVPRFFPFELREALSADDKNDAVVFRTSQPGRLANLRWERHGGVELTGDMLVIEPHAAGLNFRDVLVAMGIVGAPIEEGFGLEGAGVVSHVGPDVKDLKIGDRVIFMGHSIFASQTLNRSSLCAKMPDDLSFDDGATMPCVYSTALYSLFNIGNLKKGQTVLIHSATGGVGIAAIQLAQMVGADIFTTCGNPDKVDYLMKTFNIPRNRIFNSRDTSFAEDIARETDGAGVDLVLNSLSGELLHATWKCVAKFGKMVEIGKRDLLGSAKLDMMPFLENRSYCCVDLDQLCNLRPAMLMELLVQTMDLFASGKIQPIRPIKTFPATNIVESYRYMQQGVHMGKIVIQIRDDSGQLQLDSKIHSRQQELKFDADGYYLLVGGLGGIGQSISTWMVEHGARHLIFLSRSAGDSARYQDFVNELKSMGCEVQMIGGSVISSGDVRRAVKAGQGKLKGILQLSMALRDEAFTKMTFDDWNTSSMPKVEGTWNLHNASAREQLDFFVLFSSISGQIGTPGQANYASANTFLDAFAQYRAGLGLPASVIDIGAVSEIGYVAQNEKLMQRLQSSSSLGDVTRNKLLNSLAAAMTTFSKAPNQYKTEHGASFCSQRAFTLGLDTALPIWRPENRALWKNDMRMAVFYNETGESVDGGSGSNVLKLFLARARYDLELLKDPETTKFIAVEIGKQMCNLMLKPEEELDIHTSLATLGVDSLIAIEMRSWWKLTTGFEISVLEMMNLATLEAMAKHAVDTMIKNLTEEENAAREQEAVSAAAT